MAARVDRHLEEMAERGEADRRNASYGRWLMTELGEIELRVPRTRRFSALEVVRAYAQRASHIDQMILACFVLGLSTRKVAVALQPVLGRRISPGTVSQVAKLRYPTLEQRKAVRTTNAIERRFREVRRRTRPMGVVQDRTSMDRILFAVFTHENRSQGVPSLFSLTQSF